MTQRTLKGMQDYKNLHPCNFATSWLDFSFLFSFCLFRFSDLATIILYFFYILFNLSVCACARVCACVRMTDVCGGQRRTDDHQFALLRES